MRKEEKGRKVREAESKRREERRIQTKRKEKRTFRVSCNIILLEDVRCVCAWAASLARCFACSKAGRDRKDCEIANALGSTYERMNGMRKEIIFCLAPSFLLSAFLILPPAASLLSSPSSLVLSSFSLFLPHSSLLLTLSSLLPYLLYPLRLLPRSLLPHSPYKAYRVNAELFGAIECGSM